MEFKQPITELQNQAIEKIISNEDIVKALIIFDENFLNVTPTQEQQDILDNPTKLIRTQIFPYKKKPPTDNAVPCISSAWVNFRKQGNSYQSGKVYWYIMIPLTCEKTVMGIRYNFIADKLDEVFSETGIGKFELYDRGDFDVLVDGYIGHYIAFNITDFHINVSDSSV